MDQQKRKQIRQLRRRHHVRSFVRGTAERPRLTVFRSCGRPSSEDARPCLARSSARGDDGGAGGSACVSVGPCPSFPIGQISRQAPCTQANADAKFDQPPLVKLLPSLRRTVSFS